MTHTHIITSMRAHHARHLAAPLLALLLAVATAACTHSRNGAPTADTPQADSAMAHIRQMSMTRPRVALAMLDTAERSHTLSDADVNALRAMVYSNAGNQNSTALRYVLKACADTATLARKPQKHLKIMSMLAYQYFKCSLYDRSIEAADEGVALASRLDEKAIEARLLNVKAMCESEVGLTDKALMSFDQGIDILDRLASKEPSWSNCSDLVELYSQKANVLLDNHRYTDVAQMYEPFRQALDRQLGRGDEGVAGGNDRAQAVFCAVYALVNQHLGNKSQAHDFYTRLCQTHLCATPNGYTYMVPYLMAEQRYGEAIKMLQAEERHFVAMRRDTVDYYFVKTLLPSMAQALYAEGRHDEAARTGLRAIALSDSLARRLKTQQALWTSEVLDAKNKDIRISTQAKDLRLSNGMAIAATLLLVVMGLLTARVIQYNRIIRRKNLAAAKTINELLAYKDQMAFLLRQQQKENAAQGATAADGAAEEYDEAEHKMFIEMEQRIINDRLFLKPKLSRDDITSLLGIPKNRFAALFTRYSGKTFNRFINDMRLDYAAQQLCQNPNFSVEAVAADCGIPVRQTFYRLFTEKFGLTPAEYRKNKESLGDTDNDAADDE